MRTEKDILAEIAQQKALYLEQIDTQPAGVVNATSERVKALQQELTDLLSSGATACTNCGAVPIGMKRRPHVYEVGCLNCQDVRSFGGTSAEAVENWNAGQRAMVLSEWLSA